MRFYLSAGAFNGQSIYPLVYKGRRSQLFPSTAGSAVTGLWIFKCDAISSTLHKRLHSLCSLVQAQLRTKQGQHVFHD